MNCRLRRGITLNDALTGEAGPYTIGGMNLDDRISALLGRLDKSAFTAMPPDQQAPPGAPGGAAPPPGMPPGGAPPPGEVPPEGMPPEAAGAPPPGPPPPSEAEMVLPELIQAVENLVATVQQQGTKIAEFEKQHDEMATALAEIKGRYDTLTDILRNPDPLLMYQRNIGGSGGAA